MSPRPDPERAKQTPFGGTIAHGYYTLSLAPMLAERIFALDGFAFAVNPGLDKVRFPGAAPGRQPRADAREAQGARGRARRGADHGGATFEREGGDEPVCVAETLARVYTG